MHKSVILKIVDGDFQQGFPVILEVREKGNHNSLEEIQSKLPSAPIIAQIYEKWHSEYHQQGFLRQIKPKTGITKNISIRDSAQELESEINNWLNSPELDKIRSTLSSHLPENNEYVRFIIQADDEKLWRLPWHIWKFLDDRFQIEVGISPNNFKRSKSIKNKSSNKTKVNVLVILGESSELDINQDLKILTQELTDANICPLVNPKKHEIINKLWDNEWDILFFAGHSSSEGQDKKGRFYINENESLTIDELKQALDNSIQHGLQLAIFNSCDGIGLAKDLISLQIPAMIFMREAVPDKVAQKFLEYFLKAFAKKGKSLYNSVREARQRLQESEEKEYPCASWLPVICQNPAENFSHWQDLLGETNSVNNPTSEKERFKIGISLEIPVKNFGNLLGSIVRYKMRLAALGALTIIGTMAIRPAIGDYYLLNIGFSYQQHGNYGKAAFYYDLVSRVDPGNIKVHGYKGNLYEIRGERKKAIEEYEKGFAQADPLSCNNLFRLYILNNQINNSDIDLESGLNSCEEQVKKKPDQRSIVLKNKGWLFLKKGRLDDAQKALEFAIELDRDNGGAYCWLAEVLDEKLGKQQEALKYWDKCYRLANDNNLEETKLAEKAENKILKARKNKP